MISQVDVLPEIDPTLLHDWHPVAASGDVGGETLTAALLFGHEIALWRDAAGIVRAFEDRCPHRGTRLSIGKVIENSVRCAYHGWRFGQDGQCAGIPAHPAQPPPPGIRARAHAVRERYGLVWACLGNPAADVLPFPEYPSPGMRKVLCGPYDVETSGPRIVENFLDMAHFPFVHTGILGDEARTEVRDYSVAPFEDGSGARGLIATGCFFWQPQTNTLAHGGSEVEYTYRVVRPLTAILNKVPKAQAGFREAISLHVQPLQEERSRVWIILVLTDLAQSDQELREFQDAIFLQDKPILENQVPKRLPLNPRLERPVTADRMSVAYRKYLAETGLRYGVLA